MPEGIDEEARRALEVFEKIHGERETEDLVRRMMNPQPPVRRVIWGDERCQGCDAPLTRLSSTESRRFCSKACRKARKG